MIADLSEQGRYWISTEETNSMMKTMFPNLSILANVCLSIPVGNASVEHSFSHMKMTFHIL